MTRLFAVRSGWDPRAYLEQGLVLDLGCGPDESDTDLSGIKRVGIDVSVPFLRAAKCSSPSGYFVRASAEKLPFVDGAFQATFVSCVLHHIPVDTRLIIEEIRRVTREHLVLVEPLQSERGFPRWVKTLWWRMTDGGCAYLPESEWNELLAGWDQVQRIEEGRLFKNTFRFIGSRTKDPAFEGSAQ